HTVLGSAGVLTRARRCYLATGQDGLATKPGWQQKGRVAKPGLAQPSRRDPDQPAASTLARADCTTSSAASSMATSLLAAASLGASASARRRSASALFTSDSGTAVFARTVQRSGVT